MSKESASWHAEAIKTSFHLFLLLLLSLLAVHFPHNQKGRLILSDEDIEGLNKPETRVARKLLELGIEPEHESRQVLLDEGVETAHYLRSGRKKFKALTTPDFYFVLDNIRCFIEVGSNIADSHKRDQQKVMEAAIKESNASDILYTQLFNGHIDELEQNVHSQEELLDFLYGLSHSVFVRKVRTQGLR